jgi:hypothetical protein
MQVAQKPRGTARFRRYASPAAERDVLDIDRNGLHELLHREMRNGHDDEMAIVQSPGVVLSATAAISMGFRQYDANESCFCTYLRCIMIDLVPSPPDELSDILTDVCAVIARIILLAPPERQKEMCVLVLREINDIVEQVLDVNNIAPN